MKINFTLNHKKYSLDLDSERRLLDVLREDFKMTGTKEGCGEGECGACMILFNGKPVNSCLIAAETLDGADIMTIEGIRETVHFKIIEEAFARAGAVQCGFCTPGFIVSTYALLRKNSNPTEKEIKDALSGNLCRCTGYGMIIKGVMLAAKNGGDLWKKD